MAYARQLDHQVDHHHAEPAYTEEDLKELYEGKVRFLTDVLHFPVEKAKSEAEHFIRILRETDA